tara:strand:+ start:43708 stop:44211 length:504 start_codon:yes stop_codon:yes gene_type:complete
MKNFLFGSSDIEFSSAQLSGLVILRVLIGWHFLYEGVAKLLNPYWSSAGFLLESKWIFSGVATTIVASPSLLTFVDFINMWGLTLGGLALLIGLLERPSAIAGIALMLIYYVFNPPLLGLEYSRPTEGSYLIVNKNLIEAAALFIIFYFPTGSRIGLDKFLVKLIKD